jgi:hypothetical protein
MSAVLELSSVKNSVTALCLACTSTTTAILESHCIEHARLNEAPMSLAEMDIVTIWCVRPGSLSSTTIKRNRGPCFCTDLLGNASELQKWRCSKSNLNDVYTQEVNFNAGVWVLQNCQKLGESPGPWSLSDIPNRTKTFNYCICFHPRMSQTLVSTSSVHKKQLELL